MLRMLKHLMNHPLNRTSRLGSVSRFVRWQLSTRLMPVPHLVPFVDETFLVMERGMTGASGNWYSGLHEHADMAFTLHLLREGDFFADVGANIGSYTLLAAGAAGADAAAFEPIPQTFESLQRNIAFNRLANRVTCHNVGVGSSDKPMSFTKTRYNQPSCQRW